MTDNTKPELITALTILFSLEPSVAKDLSALKKETLEAIYESYRQNAVSANHFAEFASEHSYKLGLASGRGENIRFSKREVAASATKSFLAQERKTN